jgi:creatinine amidohydrolase
MFWQDLTWQQIDALPRSTVAVLPFGALEQHGRHLPLRTDALIGEEISRRVDAACGGRLLVLPVQWLGLSLHHMRFPGTLTASVDTYLSLATDTIASVVQAGFRKLLLLNSHGGNVAALDVALVKVRERFPDARVFACTYWNAAAEELRELRESKLGGMGHACELETSLLLASRPDLVDMTQLAPDGLQATSPFLGKDMLDGGSVTVSRHFEEISEHGGVGDPRTASAEKGDRFFRVIVAKLKVLVEEIESGAIETTRPIGLTGKGHQDTARQG